jgi:rubrerythrin
MYPDFAAVAKEEGNMEAAMKFEQIGRVEADHRDRYKKLMARVKAGTVFTRDEPITWKCSLCGYKHQGTEPPEKCPACQHPKEYYEPANLDNDL